MSTKLAVLAPVLGAVSETFVRRHIEGLAPGRTVVVTVRDERPNPSGDIAVLELAPLLGAGQWLDQPAVLDAVLDFLDDSGATVVLAEFLDVWVPVVPGLVAAGYHVVVHGHGYDISSSLVDPGSVRQYAAYASTPVVVPSEFSRRRLLAAGIGLDADGVHVVPYGVDIPPCRRDPAGDDGDIRCLAVGRMVAKKAPLLLLRAFALAAARDPRLRLSMVGDGPLLEAAEREVDRLHLDSRAVLLGSRSHDEVRGMMAGTDVFVQHSVTDPVTGDQEGLPVAILEALAAGVPVVSTRHAGIPEAVDDGVSGLLVAEGDVDGMARALCALASDGARRARMALAAAQTAAARFSWERERDALIGLLGATGRR